MRGLWRAVEHSQQSAQPAARKQRSWEVRPQPAPTAHCNIYNEITRPDLMLSPVCAKLPFQKENRIRKMSKSTFDVDLSESGQEEAGESVVNQCHGWLELTQQTIASTQPLPHTPFWSLLLFHTCPLALSCPVISNTGAANGKQIMTWLLLNDIHGIQRILWLAHAYCKHLFVNWILQNNQSTQIILNLFIVYFIQGYFLSPGFSSLLIWYQMILAGLELLTRIEGTGRLKT